MNSAAARTISPWRPGCAEESAIVSALWCASAKSSTLYCPATASRPSA